MIQRIQTVYLFLAGMVLFYFGTVAILWSGAENSATAYGNSAFMGLAFLAGALYLGNIFNFRKRKNQFVVTRIALIINLVLGAWVVYTYFEALKVNPDITPSFGIILPFLAIVLAVFANRAIMKDEALVKSADRFR